MIEQNTNNLSNLDNDNQKDEIMEPVELVSLESIYADNRQYFNGLNIEDLQDKMQNSKKYQYGNFDK